MNSGKALKGVDIEKFKAEFNAGFSYNGCKTSWEQPKARTRLTEAEVLQIFSIFVLRGLVNS